MDIQTLFQYLQHFSYHQLLPADIFEEVDAPLLSVTSLRQRLAAKLGARPPQPVQEKKPERELRLNLSMTETDFVVVEDMTSLDSNAVVLKVD